MFLPYFSPNKCSLGLFSKALKNVIILNFWPVVYAMDWAQGQWNLTIQSSKHQIIDWPNGVKSLDRSGPAQFLGLFSNEQFGVVVSHNAGLPDQTLVLQLTACYLLIDALQTHEEHAVSKSNDKQTSVLVILSFNARFNHHLAIR